MSALVSDTHDGALTPGVEKRHKAEVPRVSVIIAVHNCLPFLDECFQSLLDQEGLEDGQLEVSVVDDCSSDGSFQHCDGVWGPKMRARGIGWIFSSTKDEPAADIPLPNAMAVGQSDNENTTLVADTLAAAATAVATQCSTDGLAAAGGGSGAATTAGDSAGKPRGAAFARNQAVRQCTGEYICIQDADDVSHPERIRVQLEYALKHPNAIVGSQFTRIPEGSTDRYTRWCNTLTPERVMLEQYRELTVIQPTWFLRKELFLARGAYRETEADGSRALAEDLDFFHKHLDAQPRIPTPSQSQSESSSEEDDQSQIVPVIPNCSAESESSLLVVVPRVLVTYRYRVESVSGQTPQRLLLRIRSRAIERRVLVHWEKFQIWGAGRDGKKFYMNLGDEFKKRVTGFVDIDPKKIARGYYCATFKRTLPVRHFSDVVAPFVCCVALDRTNGTFEKNVRSSGCVEGRDYFHII